jgi:hypothetical protein
MNEHTDERPYCGDLACWCHTSVEYHDLVTMPLDSDVDMNLYDFAMDMMAIA